MNSPAPYEAVFDLNPLSMWIYDTETLRFLAVNEAAVQRYGYTRGEFLRMTLLDIRPPEDVPDLKARIAALGAAPFRSGVRRHRLRDGTIVKVEVSTYPISFNGRAARAAVAIDVSERLAAEMALRDSEERFRKIFFDASAGFAVTDLEGRFVEANQAYCDMVGYTQEELRAIDFSSLTHPDDRPANMELVKELMSGRRESFVIEKRYLQKTGGVVWARVSASLQTDGTGRRVGIFGVAENITDRRLAEQRVLRLNRFYALLSKVNNLIVRVSDGSKLFGDVCKAAVHEGGLRACWIGLIDADSESVTPAGQAGGIEGYLESIRVCTGVAELGRGPFGTAVRGGRVAVCNDAEHDPMFAPWRDAALAHNIRSAAVFPLKEAGRVVGGLVFYADTPGFFDDDEKVLLEEVASQVSFAIDFLEQNARRNAAELALQESESRFRAVFERAMVGICLISKSYRFIDINDRFCEIIGHSRESLLAGANCIDTTHPDDREADAKAVARLLSGEEAVVSLEKRYIRNDGSIVWAQLTLSLPGFADDERQFLGIILDITDRKKAEEERDRLFNFSLDLFAVGRLDGYFTQVNPAFSKCLGWTAEELCSSRWLDFVHPDDQNATIGVAAVLSSGRPIKDFQNRYRCKDGTYRWISWSAHSFAQAGQVFAVGRDVTQHHLLEEQLRQSQRLESVGQLTGGVAHDFNNLLTVIIGNAELLEDELSGDARRRGLAEMISGAAQRGAELTQRLLAFARKQPLNPKAVAVNDLTAGMEPLLRRTLGEHIEIEFVRGGGLWPALVDPAQLESALLNLSLNARDAMPDGGRLTIETGNVRLDQDYADQHVDVQPGQYVMVAVSDSGTGIAPEHLGRVFEPFFTTKETGKGTGLGLAMVYGIIKQSGGHIGIYSEPGEGTTVRLYLPRVSGGQEEAVEAPEKASLAGGTETILLVEDDEMVRRYAHDQLVSLGYRVIEAADGRQGLRIIRAREDIDLLFTDVVMPGGMSGRQLADEARKVRPELKVLYTSGYPENAIVHHGRLDPGVQLLAKPYRRGDLARAIRDSLGGQK
jgi:PAS domain S-box-containing protein